MSGWIQAAMQQNTMTSRKTNKLALMQQLHKLIYPKNWISSYETLRKCVSVRAYDKYWNQGKSRKNSKLI